MIDYMHIKDALFADGSVRAGRRGRRLGAAASRGARRNGQAVHPDARAASVRFQRPFEFAGRGTHTQGVYRSGEEAFDAAANALHAICEKSICKELQEMSETVKIGIIGIGNMGSAHAKSILAGNIQGHGARRGRRHRRIEAALGGGKPAGRPLLHRLQGDDRQRPVHGDPRRDAALPAFPHRDLRL